MPKIYLSPSTQEKNPYITGSGSEEYQMNRIADALVPYLRSSAIAFDRNTPEMTAASSIRIPSTISQTSGYRDLDPTIRIYSLREAVSLSV